MIAYTVVLAPELILAVPLDVGSWARSAVGGSMLLALPVALLAGLVSFFSPCVVPLLPGYLAYATGLGAAEVVQGRKHRGTMVAGASLFVLGLAAVYVFTGAIIGAGGMFLLEYRDVISRVLGAMIIILGLIFAGVLKLGQREVRLQRVPRVGLAAAPLLGAVFALGWTPCIGPTLGVVLNLALNEGTATRGALLAFVFTLGLGVPFIVAGLAYAKMARAIGFLRRHQVWLMRLGGVMMVAVGVLLVTGVWEYLMAWTRQAASGFLPVI